ncbi:MAG: nucleotide-binding protein [Clostridia bacterium]|nr:nucleotide-binding protein [Clostridia bacterium]
MNKEHIKKVLSEYRELCNLKKGSIINLEKQDYGRLKSTLDILEAGGYVRNLDVNGGYIYIADESFGYFEVNFRTENGDTISEIEKLINMIPELEEHLMPSFAGVEVIVSDEKFIEWKNRVLFELRELKQDEFITEIISAFDSFGGWHDKKVFKDVSSKLLILKENLDGYLLDITSDEFVEESEMSNKKVFIVHGHDEQLLNEVELMIRRIGLEPIILKNEASGGRTVIEKIEHYTDVGFGIVLYTCCDEGRKKGTDELRDRARQNVIFEHGYLCAKLNRDRVVALNDPGVEVPSDLAGVVYISHSDVDWKNQIMREMKNAGLIFDSTKA